MTSGNEENVEPSQVNKETAPDNTELAKQARQTSFLAVFTTAAIALFSIFQNTSQLEQAQSELNILKNLSSNIELEFLHRKARDLISATSFDELPMRGDYIDFQRTVNFGEDVCVRPDIVFSRDGWLATYR